VLTTSGAVRLFDVEAMRSLLTASLAPLLEDGCTGARGGTLPFAACSLTCGSQSSGQDGRQTYSPSWNLVQAQSQKYSRHLQQSCSRFLSPNSCSINPVPPAVLDARLSRMGVPLVTLSNSRAYVWSADLEGWACVADESFAVSQFMPVLSLAGQGEPLRGMRLEYI